MAENKGNNKMVEQITSMDVDFAKWYTDIVKKAIKDNNRVVCFICLLFLLQRQR